MHEGASVPDQSKISFLGPVPSEWKVVNLGSVLKELYRYPTYYGIQYVDSGVPEVRGELIQADGNLDPRLELYRHISEQTAARFPRVRLVPGDFVMSVRGTLGKVGIVPPQLEGAVITANLIRLQLNSSLAAPRWAKHFFHSPQFQNCLDAESSATTIKTIQAPTLEQIPIILPPLLEQSRIAEILDAADEAIRQTERLIAKIKAVKAGLLHDLLTHGLDEHGHLRDPQAHPEQFKDSPLGRIPNDWGVKALGDVAVKVQDGTHFSPQSTTGPFRYITSKNVRFGYLDLTDCGWISEKEHEAIYARCDVRLDDVLLTKDGANTGNAAMNELHEPFSLLSSVAFIRCDGVNCLGRYVLHYILSPVGQRRIKELMSGLAIRRLTLEKIKAVTLPLPCIEEQRRIVDALDAHDARIRAEEVELAKLRQVKRGLMDDLLTGKVRAASE